MNTQTNPSFDLAHLRHVEMYTDRFDESLDFFTRTFSHRDKQYKLQLWDSAGQERFTSLATNYLRNADCAVIVLDVSIELPGTNLEEEATVYVENELTKWMDLFNQSTQVKSFAFVVGNKIDKT